jgi:NADPH:quinone reductase-like Zn-dependent oxidoreductase
VAHETTDAWTIDDYGQREDMRLVISRLPELGDGELLVEIEAASFNPLDLKLIGGAMRGFIPVGRRGAEPANAH